MPAMPRNQQASRALLRSVRGRVSSIVSVANRSSSTADLIHPDPILCRKIRRQLLRWYDRNRRDLPWRRRQGDPYAQWVAEIMLQQTRVDTVIGYYERFLKRFPNVGALALAKRDLVLKHWEGLGYYRRAVFLHEGAKQVARNGGTLPTDAAGFRELAGIGDYTAAAIASIAFQEPKAAVDGNVARVIARLYSLDDDILSPKGKQRVQAIANALLAIRRPGDFNQAWMDLGSAICTPKKPTCHSCPLASNCMVAGTDLAEQLPRRNAGLVKKKTKIETVVGLFRLDDKVLVRQRPEGGLWSGLWEFPTMEMGSPARKLHLVNSLAAAEKLSIGQKVSSIGKIRHELTHRSMVFHIFEATVESSAKPLRSNRRWATSLTIEKLGMSTACRRIIETAESAQA